jgi:uncharacterized protein (UPF0261 family)
LVLAENSRVEESNMTFKQANEKLGKIADGRYHSLKFELTTCTGGSRLMTKCSVYVGSSDPNDGGWMASGETWAEAFDELDKTMFPSKQRKIEQIPSGVSDAQFAPAMAAEGQ